MSKLKLGPLPKTETVKVAIALPVILKAELEQYAALHSEAHGEAVDIAGLIPHIVSAFIARDRAFQKARKTGRA